MGYQIHIRREQGTISEADWRRAVEATEGLRMASGAPIVMKNPRTGEELSIASPVTDAQFLFPQDSFYETGWSTLFQYSPRGVISVKAAFDFDDPDDPVRKAVKVLADRLGAIIVGDEGETYDF